MNRNIQGKVVWLIPFTVVGVLLCAELCFARDFGAAGRSYVSTLKTVAQILSPAGIIAGGVIMQIPAAEFFGKRVLTGGIVGCACAFGGPAFVSLMSNIFGGL
jgi:hypothetical protein